MFIMSVASQGPVGQDKSNGPSAGSWGTPLLSLRGGSTTSINKWGSACEYDFNLLCTALLILMTSAASDSATSYCMNN